MSTVVGYTPRIVLVPAVSEVKFLGTLSHATGQVVAAPLDLLPFLHSICKALSGVHLALYPMALLWSIHVKALFTNLYSCEF